MDIQTSQAKKKRTQKASWNKKNTLVFCEICIQAIEKGMRPGTHLSIEGWGFVIKKFNAAKGGSDRYDKTMLKNKWDQLKKKWKLWKELIGEETGLGWNPRTHTIDAPHEWWDEKIKVVPGAVKFKKEGLEPDLVDRLDIMFSDTTTVRERARAHCSALLVANDNVIHVVSEEGNADGEEGVGDSLEEDFEKSLDEMMQNTPENADNALIVNKNKRKLEKSTCEKGKNARKESGGAEKLREDISRLVVASGESRTNMMSTPTIGELMEEVTSLPGMQIRSELYYFASYILEQRAKRESYLAMPGPEEKLGWLKFQYEMVKREKPA